MRVGPHRKAGARGGVVLATVAVVVVLALALMAWTGSRHDMRGGVGDATLKDEGLTALFEPARQPGERMRFDRLEVQESTQVAFFVRAGLRGLHDLKEWPIGTGYLQAGGFPTLELAWPSPYLPPQPLCDPRASTLAQACPVFTFRLRSSAPGGEKEKLLAGDARLPSQQQVPFERREVTQWTAFHTRAGGAVQRAQWDGWSCDTARVAAMNARIEAWGAERDEWIAATGDAVPDCHRALSWWRRWVDRGGEEHPVLWSCTGALRPGGGRSCSAEFMHAGRLVTLQIPGGTMKLAQQDTPSLLQLRLQMVRAAWSALEHAAAAAQATPSPADWQALLQQELAWCEALGAHSEQMHARGLQTRDELREQWGAPDWRLDTVHHRHPCSKAVQRVLGLREKLPANAGPALLDAARRVAAVERQQRGRVSEPLWTLVGELLAAQGEPSLALLQWRAQAPYLSERAGELLAAHDALGSALDTLPVAERVTLRTALAHAVSRGPESARAGDLFWLAAREWGEAPTTLSPVESSTLLVWAAVTARRLPEPERSARLQQLVPLMERQAQSLQAKGSVDGVTTRTSVAMLTVHAAWTAQALALQGGTEGARWREWLANWHAWASATLGSERPQVVEAVALHRDAARSGVPSQPDCPGGPLFGCTILIP